MVMVREVRVRRMVEWAGGGGEGRGWWEVEGKVEEGFTEMIFSTITKFFWLRMFSNSFL